MSSIILFWFIVGINFIGPGDLLIFRANAVFLQFGTGRGRGGRILWGMGHFGCGFFCWDLD